MNHASADPTLVVARHQRYGTHACLCGWTDYNHTYVSHLFQQLGRAGFVIVDARTLVGALTTLGYDAELLEVSAPTPRRLRLGGVSEVARECGVGKSAVSMWATRSGRTGFPAPYARLASGCVYDLDEVQAWHKIFTSTRNGAHT